MNLQRTHRCWTGKWILILTMSPVACGETLGPLPPSEALPPVPRIAQSEPAQWDPPYICLARNDGSNVTTLTRGSRPAWSPDGRRIAFQVRSGIRLIDVDGSSETVLRVGVDGAPRNWSPEAAFPVWSPDGKRIAFRSADGISVMKLDGSDFRTLIPHDFRTDTYKVDDMGFGKPAWSPDGRWLAVEHFGDGDLQGAQLYLVEAEGSWPRRLKTAPDGMGFATSDPAWSPDNARLIFWSYGYGIATMDPGGGAVEAVYGNFPYVAYGARPEWSPDGSLITFSTARTRAAMPMTAGTWIVPAQGGPATLLIPGGFEATWSPDGSHIAFSTLDGTPCEAAGEAHP